MATDAKKFFADNVQRLPSSGSQPIAYNEQRGFLAMAELLERMECELRQTTQELSAVREALHSLSNRVALLED
jgi:hypothetical protein